MKRDEAIKEIAKASCRVSILQRRKIREVAFKAAEEKLPAKLKDIDETRCIKFLLTFEGKCLEGLQQFLVLRKLNYLFRVEQIIQLTNLSSSSSSSSSLLKQHQMLVTSLGLEKQYAGLFPHVIDSNTIVWLELPKVIVDIIVDYCAFCWEFDKQ